MSVQSEWLLAYRRSRRTISSNVVRLRPVTCQSPVMPGFGLEHPPPVPAFVLLHLVRQRRPWPDERHVAAQHVPELRQLVEARVPQEWPIARDPRIVDELEDLGRRQIAAWPRLD